MSKTTRIRKINPHLVSAAMTRRITQRMACRGSILLPAVPAMVDHYVELCADLFAAAGREFRDAEMAIARQTLLEQLSEAFAGSQRSKVEIRFEAEPARPLGYSVNQVPRSIAEGYERWIDDSGAPLFGAHPDARITSLASTFSDPPSSPILDFGAGTGRNALALARLGHPVDAVEITPRFAEILRQAAVAEGLRLGVIVDDVFRNRTALAGDYRMLLASEVVPDFRGVADLRRLFALASEVLREDGLLVFNVHLCAPGFTPDRAARELAQQCYSCLFLPSEVEQAREGLPFLLVADDSVHDFEKEHLPASAFPPTPWFVNWTTGRDVYEVDREACPVDMRWLVFRRHGNSGSSSGGSNGSSSGGSNGSSSGSHPESPAGPKAPPGATRVRRFDPASLRKAVVSRLDRRMIASGSLTFPALPAMLDAFADRCCAVFTAIDRPPNREQAQAVKDRLGIMLDRAFSESPRSDVFVTYEAPFGEDLRYTITADPVPLPQAYEQWHEGLGDLLFGTHPDARVLDFLAGRPETRTCPVLDIGAGLGRNAIYLAQRGYPVDAVELAPRLAEALRSQARQTGLSIRVLTGDILDCVGRLRHDYGLVLLSGTAGDLRGIGPLRRVLAIAAEALDGDGQLLVNLHLAVPGYEPDAAARQWAEQCGAMFLTRTELAETTTGLPLLLLSDESTHDYEQAHLPPDAWPPTPSFPEWALGQHMYALAREQCPIESRWLVYRRQRAPGA